MEQNKCNKLFIYYELCDQTTMPFYPFFTKKLKKIQKLTKYIPDSNTDNRISNKNEYDTHVNGIIEKKRRKCSECSMDTLYRLGNIIWDNNINHLIDHHFSYPSLYFIQVIINSCIIDDIIVNPPIELEKKQIPLFDYIPLSYNKLLIIDALMYQGSYPRYVIMRDGNEKYIYSEHSGALSMDNKVINNIIVSTQTDRIDPADNNIFLPNNIPEFKEFEYLFHTHPNASKYGGRIKEGIVYEFPSANDIFNFIKYYNEGIVNASIIVSPEGIYVIRPVKWIDKYEVDHKLFTHLKKFILKLEQDALNNLKRQSILNRISNPNTFQKKIAQDMKYITLYNQYINDKNIHIEYYPREKKNDEWCLRPIMLQYISKKN